ncbi:Gfo/Idh/MocA family oxidoreductase [Maribellus maritimus]|uniref:Gfo/Idh/MocA family oxidoreductase n=1 Tax=Maribellus maritimus TaxID=2870838 RepID=UPI001EEAFF48|nr:Gfo/Idh/MocA family oxidoreductase [Maribellus maritimus]MCG6188138.1 Gfo/Idh/MocA family oxidoreductase [Maribellus maritimus]
MKKFGLIGAAGYIAERHMKAIKETGNKLLWAADQFDVMGRMDSYFPEAEFYLHENATQNLITETEPVDFISICSPNYIHASHIRFALKNSSDVICEKPLVIYPNELVELKRVEQETGKKVFTVLQLRYHPEILALKRQIENKSDKVYDVDLTYITSRGKWYFKSWKGDIEKSGGVATNIGIHFFDMLLWIFGKVRKNVVHIYEPHKAAGFLELEKANVRWFMSLDCDDLPQNTKEKGLRTYRSINVSGEEIEFSGGFTDLHTVTYQNILSGNGFGIDDARESIVLTDKIRNTTSVEIKGEVHPLLIRHNL